MNVLLAKNFDVENLKYSELKVMKSGAKSVYINYKGNKVNLQTPILNIPYGVNDNMQFIKKDENRKDEERKYDVTVSFKGMDENPKIKQFHDKMKELENKIIDDAFANRLVWFKNNYSGNKEVVSNMFTPIVKHDKDKLTGEYANKYPPTFKAKIPYNSLENKFEFDCYDMDNNETNFNDILANLKGGRAQFIIQLSGIWFSAGMFGCSWKIVSAKFQQINTSKITFVADSDDDNANDEEDEDDISVDTDVIAKISQKPADKKTVVEKVAPTPAKTVHKPIPQEEEDDEEEDEDDEVDDKVLGNVEEEAEDDEDEEDDEPEPPPVKVEEPVKPEAKAKKAVVKKK
jgi:hypothetical protein|uniref:Uncharacterized protein n=1 Tax=viral metagenome TaxID=1070528 RepID=A0A6C0CC60_9ZZZZ